MEFLAIQVNLTHPGPYTFLYDFASDFAQQNNKFELTVSLSPTQQNETKVKKGQDCLTRNKFILFS